ncbi:hypothetical protein [Rheinheimera sp.]
MHAQMRDAAQDKISHIVEEADIRLDADTTTAATRNFQQAYGQK